jgi:hypothetical protein
MLKAAPMVAGMQVLMLIAGMQALMLPPVLLTGQKNINLRAQVGRNGRGGS